MKYFLDLEVHLLLENSNIWQLNSPNFEHYIKASVENIRCQYEQAEVKVCVMWDEIKSCRPK